MRVLAVTHGRDVRPEVFADVLAEDVHDLVEWDIRRQGAPATSDTDAVIVLGGAQNVGEELEHPWLHEEYEALRRWVDEGVPLLGVCLGAQTLARALGAKVHRLATPLSGFYASELTDAGAEDPVLGVLPRRFDAFNANGYSFEPPPGAVELARGPIPQAFRVNGSAWGVQFHPEIRRDQVLRWFEEDAAVTRPQDEIAAELDEKLAEWQDHGRGFLRAFLAQARP